MPDGCAASTSRDDEVADAGLPELGRRSSLTRGCNKPQLVFRGDHDVRAADQFGEHWARLFGRPQLRPVVDVHTDECPGFSRARTATATASAADGESAGVMP